MIQSRKRVGGGFVYVTLPPEDKAEKEEKSEGNKAIVPPLQDVEGAIDNTTQGRIRYGDYPILSYIQENTIGNNIVFEGPFGNKRAVYCDYTASGRLLTFIEDYIQTYVCPYYSNIHSDTGHFSRQTAKFREDARDIIKQCVNASKDDVVVFTGSGVLSGMHRLSWALKINQIRVAENTCMILSPYEHQSNILLWKEFGATVVRVRENFYGNVDMEHMETLLKFWKEKKRLIIVTMPAASNLTGILVDTELVARIAHKYGALAFFDFASAGPYAKIDMNPSKKGYKDAAIVSPHKFAGGPGAPGLIIAKKWVFRNQVPHRGGAVVFASRDVHSFVNNIETREEGGTPAIIESIRTGLAFQLKEAVGYNLIRARERDICRRVFSIWDENRNLTVFGSRDVERIPIFSFLINHPESGRFLHHNFISTLLNDVFGIQSRGCICAGPYSNDLLGISEPLGRRLKWFTQENRGMEASVPSTPMMLMTPGVARMNFPYFYDDETVDYVIKAVDMVATYGWKLLPQYTFDAYSGSFWRRKFGKEPEGPYSLRDLEYTDGGKLHINRKPPTLGSNISYQKMLMDGQDILTKTHKKIKVTSCKASTKLSLLIPKDRRKLRWFLTPLEAIDFLAGRKRKPYRKIYIPRDFKPNPSDVDYRWTEVRQSDSGYRYIFSPKKADTTKGLQHTQSLQNLSKLPLQDNINDSETPRSLGTNDGHLAFTDRQAGKGTREDKQSLAELNIKHYRKKSSTKRERASSVDQAEAAKNKDISPIKDHDSYQQGKTDSSVSVTSKDKETNILSGEGNSSKRAVRSIEEENTISSSSGIEA